MPTIEDFLEGCVVKFIELLSQRCWECSGSGTRTRALLEVDGSELFVAGPDETVTCETCNGTGVFVPGRYDHNVAMEIMSTCITGMMTARSEESFGRMNAILDWGYRYVLEKLAHHNQTGDLEVALEQAGRNLDFVRSKLHPDDRPPLSGALTEKELATLLPDEEEPK